MGPNGAGTSNTARLLTICQRALDLADGATGGIDRQLAMFLDARHMGSQSQGIEVRVAIKLTNDWERSLVTEFFRAMIATTLIVAVNPSPGTGKGVRQVWGLLFLPRGVRQSWEQRFPDLRLAA